VSTSDAWVPVKLRWRHVRAGDVFFSAKTGDLWHVTEIEDVEPFLLTVHLNHGGDQHVVEMDRDAVVQVLTPVPERDAMRIARDELGARLVERRTT
jgi:hypothetical protein